MGGGMGLRWKEVGEGEVGGMWLVCERKKKFKKKRETTLKPDVVVYVYNTSS